MNISVSHALRVSYCITFSRLAALSPTLMSMSTPTKSKKTLDIVQIEKMKLNTLMN